MNYSAKSRFSKNVPSLSFFRQVFFLKVQLIAARSDRPQAVGPGSHNAPIIRNLLISSSEVFMSKKGHFHDCSSTEASLRLKSISDTMK